MCIRDRYMLVPSHKFAEKYTVEIRRIDYMAKETNFHLQSAGIFDGPANQRRRYKTDIRWWVAWPMPNALHLWNHAHKARSVGKQTLNSAVDTPGTVPVKKRWEAGICKYARPAPKFVKRRLNS